MTSSPARVAVAEAVAEAQELLHRRELLGDGGGLPGREMMRTGEMRGDERRWPY